MALPAARHAQFVAADRRRVTGGLFLAPAVLTLAFGRAFRRPLGLVGLHLLDIRARGVRKDLPGPCGDGRWLGLNLGCGAGGGLTDTDRGPSLPTIMRHWHDAQVDVRRLVGRRGMDHGHGGGCAGGGRSCQGEGVAATRFQWRRRSAGCNRSRGPRRGVRRSRLGGTRQGRRDAGHGLRLAQNLGDLAVTDDGLSLVGLPQPFGDAAAAALVRIGLIVGQHLRTDLGADRGQAWLLRRP